MQVKYKHQAAIKASGRALLGILRRGDDTVGNPHRAQVFQFELFELSLLLKLGRQFPVEQFEATVSQSTVSCPHLVYIPVSVNKHSFCSCSGLKFLRPQGMSRKFRLRDSQYCGFLGLMYVYISIFLSLSLYIYIYITHIRVYIHIYILCYAHTHKVSNDHRARRSTIYDIIMIVHVYMINYILQYYYKL